MRLLPFAFLVALGGCNATEATGDGAAFPADLASAPADLAVAGCQPPCAGTTPVCNDQRECVVCVVDGDCPAGMVCKSLNGSATCLPGCTTDDRCRRDG